ncbi:hypothetical protein [Pediococcus stilesii]|uniref:Uncharacterized protein n=1 Tax=Pediococcus stilesii TaxID=331679 RepID=A0A0R2L5B9_9LACO|nr:hypothetical protein [Pediococcus stilesii]KRN93780.1 hypothetical protein IV81_GL000181 [Pediococcus stilesii]
MKKEKRNLLDKDINQRITYEKKLKPQQVKPPEKKFAQILIGVILFGIVFANLIYALSTLLMHK